MNQLCKVCGEPAAGFHFGAFTCEGCKSFFGRTYNNVSGVSECKNGGRCEINKKNRTSCKSCRLRKCLQVGMSKSGSRYGRRSNWFKIHCLLSSQGQNGGMNSMPETNNNNSSVTNNNNANNNSTGNNHHHHHSLPSTVTSHGHGPQAENQPDRDHHRGNRQRSSSSGNSHQIPNNFLPNLSGMSPESKEQFLSSLNRKMMTPDMFEYFRAAMPPNGVGGPALPKPFFPEERDETSRSPGSLESPNSEASGDDNKSSAHLPLFGLPVPPVSPLDIKPNDILSFDLLTRDLMKLGYDPARFWPAMLSTPPTSLHQFNPYRFMFPGAVPAAFPPSPLLGNGFLGGSLLPLQASSKLLVGSSSTEPAPAPHSNRRFPLMVTPSSSLTLTPPISHHGSDEPSNLSTSTRKTRKVSSQDHPIDLSAKTIMSNNNNESSSVKAKSEAMIEDGSESDISDFDDDEEARAKESDDDSSGSSVKKAFIKKEFRDQVSSDQDEDQDGDDESDSYSLKRCRRKLKERRPSSPSGPPSPKKLKVSTPLDLTRVTNSNPPPAKVAT